MSTPEQTLGAKLWEASTFGNFMSAAGMGLKIYSLVEDAKKWNQLWAKLDEIKAEIKAVNDKVGSVYAQIVETQLIVSMGSLEDDIGTWFSELESLERFASRISEDTDTTDRTDNESYLKGQQEKLLRLLEPLELHIQGIHKGFMGTRPSFQGKRYMEFFADVVKNPAISLRTQSDYYYALTRFEQWLDIQRKGLFLLKYRYNHEQPKNRKAMKSVMDRVAYDLKISNMKLQAQESAKYVKKLNQYYSVANDGKVELTDFYTFGITSVDDGDIFNLDTNTVVTDPGNVVVGLQFYRDNDRLALKILQAPFSEGVVSQDEPTSKVSDTKNKNVHRLITRSEVEEYASSNGNKGKAGRFLIDMASAEVGRREVITGAQLFVRLDLIGIAVQAAKLTSDLKGVDESSRKWYKPPVPATGVEEKDYWVIQTRFKYINAHALVPQPLAPLRGVTFGRDYNGSDYRLNFRLRTGLCDIEDIWEKYDLLAGYKDGSRQVALGHEGPVTVKDSGGFILDKEGRSRSTGEFQFDLMQCGDEKIAFRHDGRFLGIDGVRLTPVDATNESRMFSWFPTENGSIILLAANRKFVSRVSVNNDSTRFSAGTDKVKDAERFQIVTAPK